MPLYLPAAGGGNTTYTSAVASAPGSPTNGDQWWPSDGGGLYAVRVSGAWQWYYEGQPVTLPVDANFTWTNQRSTTKDTSDGSIYLYAPADSTDSISMYLATLRSTPYTIKLRLEFTLWDVSTQAAGVMLRNSSTTDFIMLGHYGAASGNVLHHFASNGTSTALTGGLRDTNGVSGPWPWWAVTDDGTTRKYYISRTGRDGQWLQHFSHAHTGVTTPNQIGIGIESRNTDLPAAVRLLSWAEAGSVTI